MPLGCMLRPEEVCSWALESLKTAEERWPRIALVMRCHRPLWRCRMVRSRLFGAMCEAQATGKTV